MKRIHTGIIILGLLATTVAWHAVIAQSRGSINLNNLRVEQVLEVYKAVTKAELIVASNVKQAARTVSVQSERDLTPEETARLLEQALLKQAGVVVTRLESGRVSITYNDQLDVPGDARAATPAPTARAFVPKPPPDLRAFGTPGAGTIRVTIYGQIKSPGIYYLRTGSLVRDAITTAGGLTDFTAWSLSRLIRQSDEIWRFTNPGRQNDEQILLREGDRIYFGRHVD